MAEIIRDYVIETRRFTMNGTTQFDHWISNNENIKIENNYIRFIPIKGKEKGKRIYIPFDNIHVVREV